MSRLKETKIRAEKINGSAANGGDIKYVRADRVDGGKRKYSIFFVRDGIFIICGIRRVHNRRSHVCRDGNDTCAISGRQRFKNITSISTTVCTAESACTTVMVPACTFPASRGKYT